MTVTATKMNGRRCGVTRSIGTPDRCCSRVGNALARWHGLALARLERRRHARRAIDQRTGSGSLPVTLCRSITRYHRDCLRRVAGIQATGVSAAVADAGHDRLKHHARAGTPEAQRRLTESARERLPLLKDAMSTRRAQVNPLDEGDARKTRTESTNGAAPRSTRHVHAPSDWHLPSTICRVTHRVGGWPNAGNPATK